MKRLRLWFDGDPKTITARLDAVCKVEIPNRPPIQAPRRRFDGIPSRHVLRTDAKGRSLVAKLLRRTA